MILSQFLSKQLALSNDEAARHIVEVAKVFLDLPDNWKLPFSIHQPLVKKWQDQLDALPAQESLAPGF